MKEPPNILSKIVSDKKSVVARRRLQISEGLLREKIDSGLTPVLRNFHQAIKNQILQNKPAIIAELKKTSPSKGVIRRDFKPDILAKIMQENGAVCLSVLTETIYFHGQDAYLQAARASCSLPVLRKDFIIDAYQIYESRVIGADCILLIAAILTDEQLQHFYQLACELNLHVLVEVHDEEELKRVLPLNLKMIGVNNRDLRTFEINLQTVIDLSQQIPEDCIVVCESGIHSRDDIALMRNHHIHAFLIGETLMLSDNPGEKLVELCSF